MAGGTLPLTRRVRTTFAPLSLPLHKRSLGPDSIVDHPHPCATIEEWVPVRKSLGENRIHEQRCRITFNVWLSAGRLVTQKFSVGLVAKARGRVHTFF